MVISISDMFRLARTLDQWKQPRWTCEHWHCRDYFDGYQEWWQPVTAPMTHDDMQDYLKANHAPVEALRAFDEATGPT